MSSNERTTKPEQVRIAVLAVAVLTVGSLAFISGGDAHGQHIPRVPAPSVAVAPCPDFGAPARQRAEQLLELGNSKRALWGIGDGFALSAAQLFRNASACFEQAGEAERAHQADDDASAMLDELKRVAQAHHVRIEYARVRRESATARRELAAQLSLFPAGEVAPAHQAYRRWLLALDAALRDAQREKEAQDGR